MKLTMKGIYALNALLDIAINSNGDPIRLSDISERQEISLLFLEKLFRSLRSQKVVTSLKGPGGGYILTKSPDKILVRDILEAVGEDLSYKTKKGKTTECETLSLFFDDLEFKISKALDTPLSSLKDRNWSLND